MERIKVSNDVKQLTGEGTEYLVDIFGNVVAKFLDGSLVTESVPQGNSENTAIAA